LGGGAAADRVLQSGPVNAAYGDFVNTTTGTVPVSWYGNYLNGSAGTETTYTWALCSP
jgi:hypothetical protein